jgi:hypothetical protein
MARVAQQLGPAQLDEFEIGRKRLPFVRWQRA